MKRWTNSKGVLVLLLLLFVVSCTVSKINDHRELRQTYENVNAALHENVTEHSFFKIHFKNGEVAIINEWELNNAEDSLSGEGQLFDFNRNRIDSGLLSFSVGSMAIIETNNYEEIQAKDADYISSLAVLTGINLIGAVACLSNPKACFGSCPTFYVNNETPLHEARAEGFSNAIAPVLENRDVDALKYTTTDDVFRLYMKNEAYETHVVNQVDLWAVPKRMDESVFVDENDQLYVTGSPVVAQSALVNEEDVSLSLFQQDQDEYFSLADSNDLTSREELLLEFKSDNWKAAGLVISFRQTLLTTFLLYEGLSWMGEDVGTYFAKMESSKALRKHMDKPFRLLGDIDCYIWNSKKNKWLLVQKVHEIGPIAKNLQIIALPSDIIASEKVIKIKLVMAKGLWRLDYAGLAEIKEKAEPITILPSKLVSLKEPNTKTVDRVLYDDEKYLVTFPGDEYLLEYQLPVLDPGKEHELFIAAKGYYLEWIREGWLVDKDPQKIKKLLLGNKATWHSLAREYKAVESQMEALFWNSKYYGPEN